jgi:hypothetical protein
MNLLQTSADPEWDKVTAIDDAQDENEPERPRKKRRKYIARAWYAAPVAMWFRKSEIATL